MSGERSARASVDERRLLACFLLLAFAGNLIMQRSHFLPLATSSPRSRSLLPSPVPQQQPSPWGSVFREQEAAL